MKTKNLKKIILFVVLFSIAIYGCKPSDNIQPSATHSLLRSIATSQDAAHTTYDTSIITYNADSSILQIVNPLDTNHIATFIYSNSSIKKVVKYQTTITEIDSFSIGTNGLPTSYYQFFNGANNYNKIEHYTYNTNGGLCKPS